jgi:argininosuccinate lyase
MTDTSTFPAPVYSDTVLAPLFEGAKAHAVEPFRRIDRAHLVMLAETGILARDDAAAIARGILAVEAGLNLEALRYDGSVEDFFFLVERELKSRLGADLAGRLHTGRSRNDIDHTIFKLNLKVKLDTLIQQGRALAQALVAKAESERATLIVAYTHGQPAQPSTFGHYLSAMLEVLLRDLERLEQARAIVDRSPMGAAAITTSGFPLDRHRVAALLGFAAPLRNSYSCIAAVDYLTAPYAALKLLMLHLGRPIQDFAFWSAFEVGQLYVPNSYVQISSIMPQKRNPVPIEHLRHMASTAAGKAETVLGTIHNTPFTDMNDSEGDVQQEAHGAFAHAGRVLTLLAGLVAAVRIDGERVRRNTDAACITITELADTLVREEGLSFREAHEIAAHTARGVIESGTSLPAGGYAPFRAAFRAAAGRDPALSPERFRTVVSADHFVAVRERFGGPGPQALEEAFTSYRESLAAIDARARAISEREAAAALELDQAFAALAAPSART